MSLQASAAPTAPPRRALGDIARAIAPVDPNDNHAPARAVQPRRALGDIGRQGPRPLPVQVDINNPPPQPSTS